MGFLQPSCTDCPATALDRTAQRGTAVPPARLAGPIQGARRQRDHLSGRDGQRRGGFGAVGWRTGRRYSTTIEIVLAGKRYAIVQGIYHSSATLPRSFDTSISDRIDHVVTHSGLGFVVLGIVLIVAYKLVFALGELPTIWLQSLFSLLSAQASVWVSNQALQSLIKDGIISGVGGVLSFIPIIFFMFVFIGLLEDSGYMARMAFLLDRYLRKFGLHGSSMIAMIVAGGISGGCAVPAVLSTRTIRNRAERLATIAILPFFNCGAKLPVYGLFISAFFSNYKAMILFLLTIISWFVALLSAFLIRKTILKGESEAFIMELPPYRIPTVKNILLQIMDKGKGVYKKGSDSYIIDECFILGLDALSLCTSTGYINNKGQWHK